MWDRKFLGIALPLCLAPLVSLAWQPKRLSMEAGTGNTGCVVLKRLKMFLGFALPLSRVVVLLRHLKSALFCSWQHRLRC